MGWDEPSTPARALRSGGERRGRAGGAPPRSWSARRAWAAAPATAPPEGHTPPEPPGARALPSCRRQRTADLRARLMYVCECAGYVRVGVGVGAGGRGCGRVGAGGWVGGWIPRAGQGGPSPPKASHANCNTSQHITSQHSTARPRTRHLRRPRPPGTCVAATCLAPGGARCQSRGLATRHRRAFREPTALQ
jgi:hypothetical protein